MEYEDDLPPLPELDDRVTVRIFPVTDQLLTTSRMTFRAALHTVMESGKAPRAPITSIEHDGNTLSHGQVRAAYEQLLGQEGGPNASGANYRVDPLVRPPGGE